MPVSKKILTVAMIGTATVFNFAHPQSFPSAPTIGSIASPTMPTITAPAIGDGYYIPGNTRAKPGTNDSNSGAAKKSSAATESKEKSDSDKASDILKSLTAQDLFSLSTGGGLGTILEKFGISEDIKTEGDFYFYNTAPVNQEGEDFQPVKAQLEKILSSLEDMKKQQTEMQAKMAPQGIKELEPTERKQKKIEKEAALNPKKILRFNVNGYNILPTCRTVFISDASRDGAFLLTGDRTYLSDGKHRTETFHILFRPNLNPGMESNYSAAASVTQDYLNQYSFLYQLSQRNNLTAMRTGNFISMRTNDENWKLELLLDLGKGEGN